MKEDLVQAFHCHSFLLASLYVPPSMANNKYKLSYSFKNFGALLIVGKFKKNFKIHNSIKIYGISKK